MRKLPASGTSCSVEAATDPLPYRISCGACGKRAGRYFLFPFLNDHQDIGLVIQYIILPNNQPYIPMIQT